MNKKHVSITIAVLMLLLGAGWAMGYFSGVDPEVADLERLRDENFERAGTMSDDQRRATFRGIRDRVGDLSEDQRKKFFESSRPIFMRMMNQRLDDFLAMSPEEQRAKLDERIDRMEQRRQEREANGGGDSRGGMRSGDRGKQMLDRTSPDLRAKFDQVMDLMNDRRRERGLDPVTSPRGMFGRPGGRR